MVSFIASLRFLSISPLSVLGAFTRGCCEGKLALGRRHDAHTHLHFACAKRLIARRCNCSAANIYKRPDLLMSFCKIWQKMVSILVPIIDAKCISSTLSFYVGLRVCVVLAKKSLKFNFFPSQSVRCHGKPVQRGPSPLPRFASCFTHDPISGGVIKKNTYYSSRTVAPNVYRPTQHKAHGSY